MDTEAVSRCEQDTNMRVVKIQRSHHSNWLFCFYDFWSIRKSILRSVHKQNTNNKVILTCIAKNNWNSWAIRWEMRNKDPRLKFLVRNWDGCFKVGHYRNMLCELISVAIVNLSLWIFLHCSWINITWSLSFIFSYYVQIRSNREMILSLNCLVVLSKTMKIVSYAVGLSDN